MVGGDLSFGNSDRAAQRRNSRNEMGRAGPDRAMVDGSGRTREKRTRAPRSPRSASAQNPERIEGGKARSGLCLSWRPGRSADSEPTEAAPAREEKLENRLSLP